MGAQQEADAVTGLSVGGLSKTFIGTKALDDVSIDFRQAAITALLGPNGCGKSTLIKILSGFYVPDGSPRVEIGGEPLSTPVDPRVAHARGLRFVHQDLGLVNEMTVADNFAFSTAFDNQMSLGRISRGGLRRRVAGELARFELDISPDAKTGELARSDQIMVAIARAFDGLAEAGRSGVLVLDEPTASLPAGEVDVVLGAVRQIRAAGGTVIYVTHRIDEVLAVADDLVVLRDGKVEVQRAVEGLDLGGLATLITGKAARAELEAKSSATETPILELRGVSGHRLDGVDLTLHAGEIVGVAGLAGCGRSELARLLAGIGSPVAGEIHLGSEAVSFSGPRDAIDAGIAYVPPDRARLGCIPELSVRHNIALGDLSPYWSKGFLDRRRERRDVERIMDGFDIRPRDTERRIRYLSGGNQQKAVIAKHERLEPRVLVVDEPTQGVDISGKAEIMEVLRRAARRGCGVILASSDFDEVAEMCDRVLVLDRGRPVGIFARGEIHEEQLTLMTADATKERPSS
jgi:ribose transport system ATP-binding protein